MGIVVSDSTLNTMLNVLTRKELTRRRYYKQGVGTVDFELNCAVYEAEFKLAQRLVSDMGKKKRKIIWDDDERRFIIQDTQ